MSSRKPALGFILITLLLDILGIGLIIPILPKLIQSFEGGNTAAASTVFGLLVSLYSLMQFICAPILGSLSDRFGRRSVILGSLFGSGVDYLLLAFAPSLGWFFVGRLIAGITGANYAAAMAYIADVSPPEKRAQNYGLVGAAFGLGFILGPALGGLLGEVSLRLPFLVAAVLTLLNWLYGAFALPESLPLANRRSFKWARANPVGSLMALRSHSVVFRLTATLFLMHIAHSFLQSTWVLYTGYRYQWTSGQVGVSLAIIGAMSALVQGFLVRWTVPRFGERRCIVAGLIIAAIAQFGYGVADQGWMIYVILIFGSLGAVAGPALQSLISLHVPPNEQGAVQGALASLGSVAGIIGPLIGTNLFGYFIGPRTPIHIPGMVFFFGSTLMFIAVFLAQLGFQIGQNRAESCPPLSAEPGATETTEA